MSPSSSKGNRVGSTKCLSVQVRCDSNGEPSHSKGLSGTYFADRNSFPGFLRALARGITGVRSRSSMNRCFGASPRRTMCPLRAVRTSRKVFISGGSARGFRDAGHRDYLAPRVRLVCSRIPPTDRHSLTESPIRSSLLRSRAKQYTITVIRAPNPISSCPFLTRREAEILVIRRKRHSSWVFVRNSSRLGGRVAT